MNFISVDPGETTGITPFVDGSPESYKQIRISSRKGALELEEYLKEKIQKLDCARLVIENQHARLGKTFASPIGTAAYRGAVEHVFRRYGIAIERIMPADWMYPVLSSHGCKWRANKSIKDKIIRDIASRLLGVHLSEKEQHAADSTTMGHWWYSPGLYL